MAMDDPEKMAALKKAYAEIILNTAKESAARIVVAERRAAVAQRGVAAAKDEAVATLIRLKSIMETKIKEAERTSSGQARRIQELEIQITEANDTITSLRMDIEKVNSELEQVKRKLTEYSSENNRNATSCKDKFYECEHNDDITCSSVRLFHESHSGNVTSKKKPSCQDCFSLKELSPENESASNPDLVSIIMRKVSEPYRNGYTQRICAFERKPLNKKASLGKSNERFSDFQNEIAYGEGTNKSSCRAKSSKKITPGIYKEVHLESNPLLELANICGNGRDSSSRVISSRRKVARCSNKKNKKCTSHDQDMIDNVPSSHDCFNISGRPRLNSNSSASACREMQHVPLKDELVGSMQTKKRRRTLRRQILPEAHDRTMLSGKDDADFRASLVNSDKGEIFLPPADARDDTSAIQVTDSGICKTDPESAEGLQVPTDEVKPERADVLLTESGVTDEKFCRPSESPAPPSNGMFLKYTFERKRKRGSSNSQSGVVLAENTSKKATADILAANICTKRTADEHNSLVEIQKPSQLTESSRDTRRIVQVARQLISLSETR